MFNLELSRCISSHPVGWCGTIGHDPGSLLIIRLLVLFYQFCFVICLTKKHSSLVCMSPESWPRALLPHRRAGAQPPNELPRCLQWLTSSAASALGVAAYCQKNCVFWGFFVFFNPIANLGEPACADTASASCVPREREDWTSVTFLHIWLPGGLAGFVQTSSSVSYTL